jgi:hypothetical protein
MKSFSFERKYCMSEGGGETQGYGGNRRSVGTLDPPEIRKPEGHRLSKAPPRAELLHSFYCRPVRRQGEANK